MAKIKGKWLFNNTIKSSITGLAESTDLTISFTSNNTQFTSMSWFDIEDPNDMILHISYNDTVAVSGYYSNCSDWANEAYRTVDFGSTEQFVSADFLAWMQENATQQANPTITYDLTKLNLIAGTYNITVVAKAEGYKDSVASEVVEFAVAEPQQQSVVGTWVLNDGWTAESEYGTFDVTGYVVRPSNNSTYDFIRMFVGYSYDDHELYATNCIAFTNGNEFSGDYFYNTVRPTIVISGGDDVYNESLYNWLKANATKQEAEEPSLPVWNGTDLTGTTWSVPSGWTATAGYGAFDDLSFNLKINDEDCGSFGFLRIGYYGNEVDWYSRENSIAYSLPSEITNDNSFTLTIDKGTDATNTSLIAWLRANGELTSHQMPTPTIGTFKKQYYDDTNFTTYEFEVGMTWQEWLDKYKESGWFVINGYVYTIAGAMNSAIFYNSDKVLPTDLIVNGATYMAVYTSGVGGSN